MTGLGKVIASEAMVSTFNNWGWPLWMMYLTGALEIIFALGLVFNRFVRISAMLLSIMMVVAVVVHIVNGETFIMPAILAILAIMVAKHPKKKAKLA
ncbi:DoxX family membrane protein [Candidatus Gracilibacteria bacterium]|nr:DoxX family membrane protein [Candidatus Gracilibacteria bacterium]